MPKRKETIQPSEFQTFGDLLRYLRERARLTQREMAERVGYHYSYLSRLEKNVRPPHELILRTRFIPALKIEAESNWTARLLELASEPTAPAAPASGPGWETNLPTSLTPLLGRESESAALFQILSSEDIRLVTLLGPPGVGKTRLSLHIAEQLASTFNNGALFVDLMPILDPTQVMPALAAALGTLETNEIQIFEGVKAALRERSVLIVMDNFEQVLEAAPQVAALLGVAPHVKILATSREALRLRGEQEFPLGPLPVPDAKGGSALEFPSVQLFVQRARAAKPDFHLDEEDTARVAELCRRLDGLPLAIELAAARVRAFSPADMLEQFDRRFQWLASTARDIPEWRRTLWSAIQWSYNLLDEKERTLFARLSVFAGGWSVEAAEAICGDEEDCPCEDAFEIILRLVDKSLVVAEAGGRYRFLDTIGKFAREKLTEQGALEETSNRHLRYFAGWAETLETRYNTLSLPVFQARTASELNNIRAALNWALSHREVFADGVRLAIPANLIFLEHGLIRDEYERAQTFLRETSDPSLQARLLVRTAELGMRLNQDSLAVEYCRKAEKIARELGEKQIVADALRIIGDMDYTFSKYDLAEPAYRECVQIYRELNLLPQLSRSLTSLCSLVFYHYGDGEEYRATMEEGMQIAERTGDDSSMAYALRALGGRLNHVGKYAESFAAFERALTLARTAADRSSESVCLRCLSMVANMLEEYPVSGKYAQETISVLQSVGTIGVAYSQRMLAYALLHQGLPSRAHAYALQSLEDNLNGGLGVPNCLTALAEIKLSQGELEAAARLYGYLAPRIQDRYNIPNPDSRSFERIGRALAGKNTEGWQAEGANMILEQAVALASPWTPPGSGRPKPGPTPQGAPNKKKSRR